ncbi:FAD-binding oxidoreductase [Kribbella qitaiheensis]|uniref:FAD-binding oxidoreductase n=1 Tax=Kribbella qitaiheensis TaxID=1544730 RepID=UPI00361FBC20
MTDLQFSEALDSRITGDVVAQGSPGYEDARRAWNLAADQRPAIVVFAESAADVGDAVRFARSHGMRIAPQSTGHGAMALEPLDGQLLLKTSRMRRVDVDPARRKLRVEAGAQWQDVTVPADEHGLAALAGSSPNVGVIGYTLGGGLGWLARRYGLAANSVTAVELVTADGRLARIDADHEPELFWAVRGGGTVGVVTAMEMDLYPVREVYAGALFFPIARSAEVLQTWRAWTDTVPDEMTSIARILRLPPLPDIPEHLRGQDFALVEAAYLGDARSGADLLRPLRELRPGTDTFAIIPPGALGGLHMDPQQSVPAEGDGALLRDLPGAAIDQIVAMAGPRADTSLLSVEIRHLGGALAREAPGGGAQPRLDGKYLVLGIGFSATPEVGAVVRADAQAMLDGLARWRADYDYFNFVEIPAPAEDVLAPASVRRLRQIVARYDPDQTMISRHPLTPAEY